MFSKPAAAAVALAAALALAACTDDAQAPAPDAPAVQTDAPAEEGEGFDGQPATESIKVGPMNVTVPVGLKLPDDSLVTDSQDYSLMVIDEDPQPVIDAIRASAEAAGYEVYKEISPSTFVLVGHGNAVFVDAVPNAQMLTWGPEAMKDVLGG